MSSNTDNNEMEAGTTQTQEPKNEVEQKQKAENVNKAMKMTLLVLNCIMLTLGNTGGPLLLKLYFLRGGKRKWLSSWLETSGWPIILIPLSISYMHRSRRRQSHDRTKVYFMTPPIFAACLVLGILTGLVNYMYAYGSSCLPVSTSSLLISTQLAFQAIFALFIVRHKFTPYSINSVVLLTVGAIILGLHSGGDRPANETKTQYYLGFIMTIGTALLYGCVLVLIELTYIKAKQAITYTLVMEVQTVMGFFATVFCTVGMLVNKDFQVIPKEARAYELDEVKYYVLLVSSAIIWQFFFLGTAGVIATSSSLHAGVLIAVLLPVTEILAVLFLKENFNAEKGISLGLSLWGLASYFYGEYLKNKESKKEKHQTQVELPHS